MLTASVSDTKLDTGAATDAAAAALGREDFLRMLIAQLEHQDPLNPQDSTEFTAQLAQFSSLEQQIAMRDSLGSIRAALSRTDSVTAIGMIGQRVLADGGQFELTSGGASLEFELSQPADSVELRVVDQSGSTVATIDAGNRPAGLNNFSWPGLRSNGQPHDPGVYELVVAASAAGEPVEASPVVSGTVSGADVTGSTPMLLLGNLLLPLSNVREVYASSTGSPQP